MTATNKPSNREIVQLLKEVLAAMEVKGFNKFRIRAYQNAISAIDNLTSSVYDLWENDRLGEIPGVGASLEQHLKDLFTKGTVKEFEQVKKDLPEGMFSLIGIRGIGAKKAFKLAAAFKLYDRLQAIDKVKDAAQSGLIRNLANFGEKSEKDILDAINEVKKTKNEKKRMLLMHAEEIADRVIKHMKESKDVLKIEALGSLRRRNATVGDLDIVVATNDSEKVLEHFLKFNEIKEVLARGDKKVSVELKNNVQVDIRTSLPQSFGSMIQYSTGSKQHNVVLRTYALELGLSLSEYGIKNNGVTEEFATEEAFYNRLNLQYIPPEIRHGKDEVEAAKAFKVPKLIELTDIKGDIHTHTNFSDGVNTLEEMVEAALKLGYEYIGISDHSPSIQNKEYAEVVKTINERRAAIDNLNKSYKDINILFGYEVNILSDATLSLPDELLKKLDYVIASLHTSFDQSREKITQRLLNAIENPYVTIIGHPSGRLINERNACDVDWRKIFNACAESNKMLEINSQPQRLDLADDLVRDAIERGVKLIINTDAHSTGGLLYMKYGIDVARRGWCEPKHIANIASYKEFVDILKNLR